MDNSEMTWNLYTNSQATVTKWFDNKPPAAPPGTGPTLKYSGPWLETQLVLSASIGIFSFLLFSYCRTKWPILFAPRTKLKAFSPHEAHMSQTLFAWILPTIKTSELTILQIVGLDAAVLLTFFKMSFWLFSVMSIFALTVIWPLNVYMHFGENEPEEPTDPDNPDEARLRFRATFFNGTDDDPDGYPDWSDIINATNSFRAVQVAFTFIFTAFILRALYKTYQDFVRVRQLYSLELVHSIAARTVMVTNLPGHLRGEKKLADYFENMGFTVESVNLVRQGAVLDKLIEKRTQALLNLEWEWTKYVGNPSLVETYDPSQNVRTDAAPLIDLGQGQEHVMESQPTRVVVPHRPRPTVRPKWFGPKVDALEYYEREFEELNEQVKKKRKTGRFKATDTAFVTFEKMSSAQTVSQVTHAPHQGQSITTLAPEPRDVVWPNVTLNARTRQIREITVFAFLVLLFLFWVIPISGLATLLSYEEIKKVAPWLANLIDRNDTIRAVVQNSLPSVAMVIMNAILPFLLEGLSYLQGLQARSWIEYSLMKKYFLFLLVNVVFIFLLASTYWQLVRDLANSPAKIPTKLAAALSMGRAKAFFMSYVILQALAVMPLQLLNLGVILPRFLYIVVFTRTPRDFAELNAPPMINYGAVYPQAILIFVITVLYSVIQPQIAAFGALYFGIGYVVYKYKLLFVFYKPYESQGQAWPITFVRLLWAVVIFQVLMTGIFTLERYYTLSTLMAPLILFTIYWGYAVYHRFEGLSEFVSLSSVCEVQRGEDSDDVARLRAGVNSVNPSHSNLNRRRYAQNDETLYVAPEDERTDYSQPPMSNWYYGVLNTGKRRYGHPALTGVLPTPWLPLKKGQTLANFVDRDSARENDGNTVVLTLRRRYSAVRRRGQAAFGNMMGKNQTPGAAGQGQQPGTTGTDPNGAANGQQEQQPTDAGGDGSRMQPPTRQMSHRLSFDPATGIITLPDGEVFIDRVNADDSDDDYGQVSGETDSPIRSGDISPDPNSNANAASGANADGHHDSDSADASEGGEPPSRRFSTYFHHPERRRQSQQVPGAFPH